MRDLSQFSEDELIETVRHGLDEYEDAPQESACFSVRANLILLAKICTLDELGEHLEHVQAYAEEAQRVNIDTRKEEP